MAVLLQKHINGLKHKILFVGTLVEEAISKGITALVKRDKVLASAVIDADDEIDRMEVEVEEEAVRILALYQPVAADLRFVVAVIKINNDLERMGDIAGNIARRVLSLAKHHPVPLPRQFSEMGARAQAMVKQSLDALVNADANLAKIVRDMDDEVDALRTEARRELEQRIMESPADAEIFLHLLSVSRHLERLADMATMVAEEVIFMVQGEIIRHVHSSPQGD